MMLDLIQYYQLRPYLLNLSQGLRRVTNILHLTEVLDKKARDENLSPESITRWLSLAQQGEIGDTESGTLELRIATDAEAVTVLTQHRSKGLQFPITFVLPPCKKNLKHPFTPDLTYHDPLTNEAIVAAYEDKGSTSFDLRIRETCADRARLAYVALTRSESLCHFYYVAEDPKCPEQHAVYQMLGCPDKDTLENLPAVSNDCIAYHFLTSEQLAKPIPPYEATAQVSTAPLDTRKLTDTNLTRSLSTTSFSAISHHTHDAFSHIAENTVTKLPLQEDTGLWKDLKAGASLGSTFHEILEEIDFTVKPAPLDLIITKLEKYSPWWQRPEEKAITAIAYSIQESVNTLLDHSIDGTIKLSSISLQQRMTEPEFLLRGEHFCLSILANILQHNPPPHLPEHYLTSLQGLSTQQLSGYLTGFVDLIFEHDGKFHILDWKTNRIPSNDQAGLSAVMAEHHYYLQYHLYALALDRYLANRLKEHYDPEQHLGNIYYIFLRGVDPDLPQSGVFFDQFSRARLTSLQSAYLISKKC